MTTEQMIEAGCTVFKKKLVDFFAENDKATLSADFAEKLTRCIQEALKDTGRAVFCTYLETQEEEKDVVAVNGEPYRFKYYSSKEIVGLWGTMSVKRRVYQNASDTKVHVPLDAAWGMNGERMTVEVREALAFSCAHITPEETYQLLSKAAMFHPHPTQIKREVEKIGRHIASHYEDWDERIRAQEEIPEQTQCLVASMDGANVLLNEQAAQRGRPKQRPGTQNQKQAPTAYRNAMVGSISLYGALKPGEKRPSRLWWRYTTHMPEYGAATFKAKFEAELSVVEARCPPGLPKIILCDGATQIWSYIEQHERYEGYETLVDYYHSVEHLALAAQALFGEGTDKAKRWYEKYAAQLLEDDSTAQSIQHSIAYYSKITKLSKSSAQKANSQYIYFKRNKARIRYAEFRKRGLPIGSGPIEAACKTLVKTRLGRSGMRWSHQGGQNVLALRTYVKSNRWEKFWNQYKLLKSAV
jgi:hypothetical protein